MRDYAPDQFIRIDDATGKAVSIQRVAEKLH